MSTPFTIKYRGVHHSGGLGKDNFSSTKHLTLTQINNAHKARWPEMVAEFESPYRWVGYNIVILPDGKWVQTRLIGEETCAIIGHNRDTVQVMVLGNYNRGVDKMSPEAQNTLTKILLCDTREKFEAMGIRVKEGTVLRLSIGDIHSHRAMTRPGYTECYGSQYSDAWARNLVLDHYAEQYKAFTWAYSIFVNMKAHFSAKRFASMKVSSSLPEYDDTLVDYS